MSQVTRDQPELLTPRLRLRRLRHADAGLIALYAADPNVARMTTRIPHPYPPGTAEALIERVRSGRTEEMAWALDTGTDDENGMVGLIVLRPQPDGTGTIGYWVAPAFQGSGYAGEAVEAIKDHARSIGLTALRASAFQDNLASVKVLTRAGFVYEGEEELHSVARGAMVPSFRYRLDLGA